MKRKFDDTKEENFKVWLNTLYKSRKNLNVKIVIRGENETISVSFAGVTDLNHKDLEKRILCHEKKFIQALENAKARQIYERYPETTGVFEIFIYEGDKCCFYCSRGVSTPKMRADKMSSFVKFFFENCLESKFNIKNSWLFFKAN